MLALISMRWRAQPFTCLPVRHYSLPAPPQNPITLLSGRGHQVQSEPCALDSDFDETFTRTGD